MGVIEGDAWSLDNGSYVPLFGVGLGKGLGSRA